MGARILVVDDEQDLARLIKHRLERDDDMHVELVGSGRAALAAVSNRLPDLIILDLNLPDPDGIEVCRILRGRPETSRVPIIMLTARASESDRVAGLDVGADDYVAKPFSPNELAARVRAQLRQAQALASAATQPTVYRGKHLLADFDAVEIKVDKSSVTLTRREFEILRCLVENRNRVLSRDRLVDRVWGQDGPIDTRSVDAHIGRLRRKLGSAGYQIETMVGLGYRFVEES